MASKECQDCAVNGRGKVPITQKDKQKGGQYWANADGSPHFFFTGKVNEKPQFVHPRTKDEFNWAKEHNGLNECPSIKTPYENLGIKQDTPENWEPLLFPGTLETDLHKTVIADTTGFMQNIRKTCFDLAQDLYPPDADIHSVRITACGFIHDFISMYSAAKIKEELVKHEKEVAAIVEKAMHQLKQKG